MPSNRHLKKREAHALGQYRPQKEKVADPTSRNGKRPRSRQQSHSGATSAEAIAIPSTRWARGAPREPAIPRPSTNRTHTKTLQSARWQTSGYGSPFDIHVSILTYHQRQNTTSKKKSFMNMLPCINYFLTVFDSHQEFCVYQVLGCAAFGTKLCLSNVKLCAVFVVIVVVFLTKTRLPKCFRKS